MSVTVRPYRSGGWEVSVALAGVLRRRSAPLRRTVSVTLRDESPIRTYTPDGPGCRMRCTTKSLSFFVTRSGATATAPASLHGELATTRLRWLQESEPLRRLSTVGHRTG
jgi:hypothetical protein